MSELATIAAVQAGYVDVGASRLFVRRFEGGGQSVLYWHGGGGAKDEVPLIAPALEAAGYSVYAPDAPGYGDSAPVEREQYRATAIADLALELVNELGLAPVVWIGYSWGGTIGFHAAVRNPDKIRALVLLDGGYLMPDDDPSYDPTLDFEGQIEAWRIEIEQQDDVDDAPIEIVATAMAGSNLEPALPLLQDLAATRIPVLLVAATEPAEWNDVRARRIDQLQEALPDVHVTRVQAGHGVLADAGDEVRRTVIDWLDRLG
jgi:pimeloyl-ACP methyl ester carboxylesterase